MKRIVSVLLAVCMMAGLLGVSAIPASAAGENALFDISIGGTTWISGATWKGGGGWFATVDEAALDWAENFVPLTLSENTEYGATIYRKFDWKTFSWGYTYSITMQGSDSGVAPLPPLWMIFVLFLPVATIHSHPEDSVADFSQQDLDVTDFFGLLMRYSYVAGPDGLVCKYDSQTKASELINGDDDVLAANGIFAAVERYNRSHGGTGQLSATITGPQEVTITGDVTGVTQPLSLYNGCVYIKLNANIEADAQNPPYSLIRDSRSYGTLEVVGGVLRGSSFETDINRTIVLSGENINHTFVVSGGALYGGIFASTLILKGGVIDITSSWISTTVLLILKDATVHRAPGDFYHTLSSMFAYVDPGVDFGFNHAADYISFLADADFMEFTALNYAHTYREIILSKGQTLTIPEGATVDITYGDLILDGGSLVIDGTLMNSLGYNELIINHGTVTGANAGELAGVYDEQEQPPVGPPWYEGLPPWLDFILRYYTFGWLWYFMV